VQDRLRQRRAPRWAAGSAALGLSMAALSLLGPLAADVVRYRVAPPLRAEQVGSDLVTVGVVAPLALVAAVLSRRRSPLGPLLAMGPALASWYLLAALLVGQDRSGRFAGNDTAFLPLFVCVLLLASAVIAGAWRELPRDRVVFDRPTGALLGCLLLVLCAVDVFGGYLPAWLGLVDGRTGDDSSWGQQFWWALALLNLALLLPAAAVTGVALLRRAGWAGPPAFGLSGALALVALTATGRAVATAVHEQATVTIGAGLRLAVGLAVSVAPAVVCWLAVLRTGKRAWDQPRAPAPPPPLPRAPGHAGTAPVLPVARPPADDATSRPDPAWP
jgi:hypothetical protein